MRDSNLLFFTMRAAKSDARKARRQWKLGVAACIGAAVICLVGLGVI